MPEFTANLMVPPAVLAYIFTIDGRMGLASLVTVPLGMFCYVFMIAGSAGFYWRTVTATKNLNNTAVEHINGIQVIKVFGKTKSSYERFVKDAHEAAYSYIDWMRSSILPFTFAMVIMPSTMVSVLPIGELPVKGGSLAPADFVTIIILSAGVITSIITCMSYSDDFRTMGTIFGEVRGILDAPEMERPETGEAPEDNSLRLEKVCFGYGEKEILHGIGLDIPEGSFVAPVDPSGGGKTTLVNLPARFWDVDQGKIVQRGTHGELMAVEGIYHRFVGERTEAAFWKVNT